MHISNMYFLNNISEVHYAVFPVKTILFVSIAIIFFVFREIKQAYKKQSYNSRKVDLLDEDIKRKFLLNTFCGTSDDYARAHELSKLAEKEIIYGFVVSRPINDTGLWKVVIFIEHKKNFFSDKEEKMYVVFEISDLDLVDIKDHLKIPLNYNGIKIKLDNQGIITPESMASLIDNSYEIHPNQLEPASTS
jgi:hypothetical protein